MKSYRKELWIHTKKRREFINITRDIEKYLKDSEISEGLVLVNAMHITASVFINDNEMGLLNDFERFLEKLAPEKPYSQYEHNGYEDNGDAHIKRTIMGREVVVAITNGELDFGPWEQIFYGEFDGMRDKRILVKIIGE
ncbi:secondary thiamine-phosphate synthase enzyme YjbQ [Clostridiaceae bacterium HSG29]|nr:secondary thiamine-phosphate synthase enzyme YjbQ [Clostridiaceae bacterium HSG29]